MGRGSGGDAAAATPATAFPSTPSILPPLRLCAIPPHPPPCTIPPPLLPPPIVTTLGAALLAGRSVLRWRWRASAVVHRANGAAGGWAIRGHRGRDERHRIGLPSRAIHPPQPLSSSSTLHPLPPTSSAVPPLFTTARRPLCSTHGAPSAQPTGAAAITAHRAATFHLFVYHKLAPGGR